MSQSAQMPATALRPLAHQMHQQTTHAPPGIGATLGGKAIPALCAVGAIASLSNAFGSTDDGAGTVPLVALLGIALASVRWQPNLDRQPSRAVTLQSALTLTTIGVGLIAAIGQGWLATSHAVGPILTVAVVSSYLMVWGYRSLALLRTISLLSLLTWLPVAGFAHDAIRSSLEQPSLLAYQRLAEIPIFGVADEPWRIFSAQLHRGALVVLATIVLSIGANRWRMSGRTVIELAATVGGALILHHAAILASPIDTYAPTDTTLLATNPTLEIAIAGSAVLCLSLVRWRRGEGSRVVADPSPETEHRDPFIFGTDASTNALVTLCLAAGLAPLALLLVVA